MMMRARSVQVNVVRFVARSFGSVSLNGLVIQFKLFAWMPEAHPGQDIFYSVYTLHIYMGLKGYISLMLFSDVVLI